MRYTDPYLSEYILKYTEMLFRKELGYNFITMPTKLIGALKVRFAYGYEYILSADKELQRQEKIYFSLYDDIEDIIVDSVREYMDIHREEMDVIKARFSQKNIYAEEASQKRKTSIDEMVEFINKSDDSNGQVEKLFEIYNKMTPTCKKTKAKKFARYMWDYWILHASEITYSQMNKTVQYNKWNIPGIQALQERRFAEALPYLRTYYDPCMGVAAKKLDGRVIADGIVITLVCIDQICRSKGIDFVELLLGKFDIYNWIIYDEDEQIKNNVKTSIVKNVGNVQIYQFNPDKNIAVVKRHSYSQDSRDFIVYLLKNIENHYRSLIGYNSLLKNVFSIEKLHIIHNTSDMLHIIDGVIATVTKFTFDYNKPIFQEGVISEAIQITDIPEREYLFEYGRDIKNISIFLEEKIKEYYGIADSLAIKANRPYEIFEIDLNHFDIHEWIYQYKERKQIRQKQISLQLYRFYDVYEDILNRLMRVKCHTVEYNPNFDFRISKIFKDSRGLIQRDLNVLSFLCDDSSDFMQWIKWIDRGKFVYSKNEPYVQILFHFIVNDWVLSANRSACLVMMCKIWNYYFKDNGWGADLYLEWIKDYWILYCSDEITYEAFKSMFIYDIEFYNTRMIVKKQFIVDMDKFDESNLLQFYNANCDYHVLEGTVVKKRYRFLLEDAIEAVHVSLKKLWAKYGLNFMDYFHIDEEIIVDQKREVFYRAILTESMKRRIANIVDNVVISNIEKYSCEYDYERNWPIFKYQIKEVSNASSRMFMEYILKLTEKGVREWLNVSYNFKFDEQKLYESFPNKLFSDNMKEFIIESTIMDTVIRVCSNSRIKTKNPKMKNAKSISEAVEVVTKRRIRSGLKQHVQNLGIMKKGVNCTQAEYDLIERNQKVDKESIEKARMVLKKNQDRLVVDKEVIEEEKNVEGENIGLFTTDERDFLKVLLENGDIKEKINELERRFISVSLLIESLNNKAIDEIGDSIIEEGEEPYLIEDYLLEVRALLEK